MANNLDTKTGGPVHESLSELGRINVVRKQFDKAVAYFTHAMTAFAQYSEKNPGTEITNQLGNAQVIEDFAYALEQAGGQQSDVKKLRERAADMREKIRGQEGVYQGVTPYGTQCNQR